MYISLSTATVMFNNKCGNGTLALLEFLYITNIPDEPQSSLYVTDMYEQHCSDKERLCLKSRKCNWHDLIAVSHKLLFLSLVLEKYVSVGNYDLNFMIDSKIRVLLGEKHRYR